MSPLALGPGLDLILGWDWIVGHDLGFLYPRGVVTGAGPGGALSAALTGSAPGTPGAASAQVLISHGEMRRMLRKLAPKHDHGATAAALQAAAPVADPPPPPAGHGGMSKPLEPLGAEVLAEEARQRLLRRMGRRRGLAPPPVAPRFADGVEVLPDGTELHLASVRFPEDSLRLGGMDHPAFAALKEEFADVLAGPPPGLPPDRGIELTLETGDRPMPRTRPLKRLSAWEPAELRKQLHDLLARGWIQPSTAGHAASVVLARKPDGTWRICYD